MGLVDCERDRAITNFSQERGQHILTIPGRNHSYHLNIPFYTLVTPDGEILSHPQSILNNQWTIHGHMSNPETQEFFIFDRPVNVAMTHLWCCAWVVYSKEDLQMLYDLLTPARQKYGQKRVPSLPYTGIMRDGGPGIVCGDFGPIDITFRHTSERIPVDSTQLSFAPLDAFRDQPVPSPGPFEHKVI